MLKFLVCTFAVASLCILILSHLARYVSLVDKPNHRKRHQGEVPLVGGISFYVTLCLMSYWELLAIPNQNVYLLSGGLLLALGVLDDKFDIRATVRLTAQIALAVWLAQWQQIAFVDLGNLFGGGNILLDALSLVFTIVAMIGAITAFNMIDGLDGVLGSISSIILLALSYLLFRQGEISLGRFCIASVVALVPFMLCNLAPFRRVKVFMGDGGSTLIGFTIVWVLLHASQPVPSAANQITISPVNALWLVALPVMDMAMVILRRCRKGQWPFKADRLHLHHICVRLGLSATQTLLLLSSVSLVFAAVAVWAEVNQINESLMMAGFLLFFVVYVGGMSGIGKKGKLLGPKPIHLSRVELD